MRGRIAVVSCVIALALLGFFAIPGHTWLHSDTQIYVPMLERIWDPSAFPGDIVATKPHLAYTLYDEIAIALRWVTRADFQAVLVFEQLVFRALQILGVYLIATALPLSRPMALLVAAISSLGATISGPSVLTIEYEPIPRGYAIGLSMLAIGLAARGYWMLASVSASLAALYHAPTTYPFWIVFGLVVLRNRQFKLLLPLAGAVVVLLVASRLQAGAIETQSFFFGVDPEFEKIQRMRAGYNWVSNWWSGLIGQYLFYWAASLLAFWRIRPRAGREFLLGMPLIGMLSLPVSYLLLERLKWGFIPQLQPARALLFVTYFAIILAAAAGLTAERIFEAIAWLTLVFAISMQGRLQDLTPQQMLLAVGLAMTFSFLYGARSRARRAGTLAGTLRTAMPAIAVLAAYLLPPALGLKYNYPHLETVSLDDAARFAREHTSKSAVFVFPDARTALYPGIFRVRAERPVYVDWKSGGQVNYYRSLAEEWWSRWQATHALQFPPDQIDSLAALGIDYVVLKQPIPNRTPLYRNSDFTIYSLAK